IFEIRSSSFGSGSIAGGGRYDDMIRRYLGRAVPATGFSIGFERVVDLLAKMPDRAAPPEKRIALLFDEAGAELGRVRGAARERAVQGYLVPLEREARSAGPQRAALERHGYDGVATVGPDGRAVPEWFAERARLGSRSGG